MYHFQTAQAIKGCFGSAFQSNMFITDIAAPLFTFQFSDLLYLFKNNSKATIP